jgi:RNA polymerase sigma factor (sigma-70 family)
MPPDSTADAPGPSAPSPDDRFLVDRAISGDAAALRRLMARYDRLVRYTIYRRSKERCHADPQWLDTVASDAWTGFIRSMRTSDAVAPRSLGGYLVRIARNQVISALRRAGRVADRPLAELPAADAVAADPNDPLAELAEAESLQAVHRCIAALDGDDRRLIAELAAITERRWTDAASALGMKESTLRSRWERVLDRLRRCVAERTDNSFAPEAGDSDR